MKNLIAAFVATSTLITCAACGTSDSSGTASTSSGADTYAEWLDDRLGDDVGNVTVGIGDSSTYGIDMSNFENDGYIIKTVGDEVLLFGKTGDGLDRAVRKYAKIVEAGDTVENVAYHEGYRIEKLTLFGVDIADFVIEVPSENNANMLFARDELVRLVKIACGAELASVIGESDAEHKIIFRFSDDETFRDDGYRYFEEDGNLVLEGARARGCMNAVYFFLQNECGWDNLRYGESHLRESSHTDIPANIEKTASPRFDLINPYVANYVPFNTDRTVISDASRQNSYGPISVASHGLTRYKWTNKDLKFKQPCFTDEDFYEEVLENITAYIDRRIAVGETPGVEFKSIDVAMADNDSFCICKNCSKILKYDKSNAGAMIAFANRLSTELNEMYDTSDIALTLLAYMSAKKAPEVTKANEHIWITYCANGGCVNHPLDGSQCSHKTDNTSLFCDNHLDWNYLNEWVDKADNIYIWIYNLDTVLQQYTVVHTLFDNVNLLSGLGIKGVMYEMEICPFSMKRIEYSLFCEQCWDCAMTEDEYEELLCRELQLEYGDGWTYIRRYLDLWVESQSMVDYFHCWYWTVNYCIDPKYDEEFTALRSEEMIGLLETAISLAESEDQERKCELLSLHVYYKACYTQYFRAYDANDTQLIAKLDSYYDKIIETMYKYGYDPENVRSVEIVSIASDLETAAWTEWLPVRERLSDPDAERRDPPTWYTESTEAFTT